MSKWSKGFFLMACFGAVISFQNCVPSPQVDFVESAGKITQGTESQTEGDGQAFDGKVYVLLGETCADQSNIQAKILLKTFTSGTLVREKCRDITPIALGTNDFQLNSANSDQLNYQNQLFTSVKPTQVIGTQLNMVLVIPEIGFAYILNDNFGTAPDDYDIRTISKLVLLEDGLPLGPAHAPHPDIRNLGRGLFSHWDASQGVDVVGNESLRFSASDNSDPRTNGRIYSYQIAP